MDTQKTLVWLNEVSEQALTEARAGNTALANKLGKVSGVGFYFNNVHTMKVLTAEQFARQYPQYIQEADALRREYEAVESVAEYDARINKLEDAMNTIKAQLATLTESLTAKPAKKVKKVAEAEVETVAAEPAPAEDEADKEETEPVKEPEAEKPAETEPEA